MLMSSVAIDLAPTWAHGEVEQDWQVVDRALRSIAAKRTALDADEARWLREAELYRIWRPLGMVSALDYMERVLGYAPRTAQDRLRVARSLGHLPVIERALGEGELSFSAVRELTRVATPATEANWVRSAVGKNLRQIEELVADHQTGDNPEDPKTPALRMRHLEADLTPQTYAKWRQARQILDDEHGTRLEDDAFYATMADAVIDGHAAPDATGRARHQISLTLCERCRQGWQHAAGALIAVDAATVQRAECDAQHIGPIESEVPARAAQDIPPAIARLVWHRDGGRCRVDGCRSSRGLELHHIIHRENGGGHDPENLVLVCGSCHHAHHDGRLVISGTAETLQTHRPAEPRAHVGAKPALGTTIAQAQAKDALAKLGWPKRVARAAVDAVAGDLPGDATLEALVRAAIRRCPGPVKS